MGQRHRDGVFTPSELRQMRQEFETGEGRDKSVEDREARAVKIVHSRKLRGFGKVLTKPSAPVSDRDG